MTAGVDGLVALGLVPGEAVRWQARPGGHWQHGAVSRRERDGSVGVTDARGAARSLAVEALEVRCYKRRGTAGWEALAERASRSEQLLLF